MKIVTKNIIYIVKISHNRSSYIDTKKKKADQWSINWLGMNMSLNRMMK